MKIAPTAPEVRAQVNGVVHRLLQVAVSIEGLTLPRRRIHDDGAERRTQRARQRRGPPYRSHRRRATLDEHQHAVRHER